MAPVCGKDVPEVREALSLYFVAAALFPKALRSARFWIDTSTDFESDSIRELLASDRERRLTTLEYGSRRSKGDMRVNSHVP